MISLQEGKTLVNLARDSISNYFSKKITDVEKNTEKRGVFVTLHTYPEKSLRGCIGFIEPIFQLNEAIEKAARSAAFNDPRFPPLQKEELNKILIEVSVLTKPELINIKTPDEYLTKINVPGDGLIINCEGHSGLLLPQVPIEFGWGVEEFLNQTCFKAGLSFNKWKDPSCSIYKFQVQIFSEEKPAGNIIEKHINTLTKD